MRRIDVRGIGACVLAGLVALAPATPANLCFAQQQETPKDAPIDDSAGEEAGAAAAQDDPLLAPITQSSNKQPPAPGKDHPGDPTITIDWGFGSSVTARRCLPVTVSITGGVDAFSGFITFRYRSDATQSMVVTVPIAATPNKTSVYTPVLVYPGASDKIEVVVSERSGRVTQHYWYAPAPGDTEIQLPQVHPGAEPLVLAIGGRQSAASSVLPMRLSLIPSRVNPAQQLTLDTAFANPAALPLLPWAYEGVSAVVVQSDAVRTMDERAMAALREWVLAGGWLVVLAASGDESWAQWLAGSATPVQLAEATNEQTPDSLAHLVSTDVTVEQSSLAGRFPTSTWATWRDSPQWMLGPSISESMVKAEPPLPPPPEPKITATPIDEKVDAAPQANLRWIRLTPEGRRTGWTLGITRVPMPPESDIGPPSRWVGLSGGTDEGLIAQGPMGYGWMTVIGFDPRKTTAQVSSKGSQRVWAHMFGLNATVRPPGEPMPRVLRGPAPPLANGWSSWGASGNGDGWGVAMPLALDAVASAEAPGRSVFLVVALAAGMVPLLIGPVDYFLLRRTRVAHRSWLTALGWIGLAAVGAWLLPLSVRSSSTTVARLSVLDVMMPPANIAGGEAGGEPLTLQSGITGVFAGGSIRGALTGLPDRAMVRGVAAQSTPWDDTESSRFAGELPVAQASPGLEAAPTARDGGGDPWGGFSRGGTEAFGDRLLETGWRLWTFRAVEDRARIAGTVRASVERLNGGRSVRVRVTGLPAGAVVRRAAAVCNGVWRELKGEVGPDGVAVLNAVGPVERSLWEPRPAIRTESGYAYYEARVGPTLDNTPGVALALHGPYERGDAINTYLESGAWDAVYLHVTGLPASVSLNTSTKNTEQAVYRIVIPWAAEGQTP